LLICNNSNALDIAVSNMLSGWQMNNLAPPASAEERAAFARRFDAPGFVDLLDRAYHPQKTPGWLSQRRVTGSRAAAILGLNPYQTAEDVFNDMVGAGVPFEGNWMTRHGEKYEPVARFNYMERTGFDVFELGLVPYAPDPRIGVSPDGIVGTAQPRGPGGKPTMLIIEIKSPAKRRPTAEVPLYVDPQCQLEMVVTGAQSLDAVQFWPEGHLHKQRTPIMHITPVDLDPDWEAINIPKLQAFADRVDEELLRIAGNGMGDEDMDEGGESPGG
jgi:putative phage-type endonuclease